MSAEATIPGAPDASAAIGGLVPATRAPNADHARTLATAQTPRRKALRPASEVMRLARMGAAFPTRLSFLPTLLRRLAAERVRTTRALWEIDAEGVGRAVYTLRLGGRPYSLVAFSSPLPPELRSDRVIADAWDATFALVDGAPDGRDLARLAANAPLQEGGRLTERELILSRANRSQRAFTHALERLAAGRRPDPSVLSGVGYLMRTTAVYGNGKFGIADREVVASRPGLGGPFQAEMLAVWLIREFTVDLVEHLARAQNPEAATRLSPDERRALGVGNSTGLGMAPFLVNHPVLVNAWARTRETALARVRETPTLDPSTWARARALFDRAARHLSEWRVEDPTQSARIATLEAEWAEAVQLADALLAGPAPWDALMRAAEDWSLETQELLVALALETHPEMVDPLTAEMACDEGLSLDRAMSMGALRQRLAESYRWALETDAAADETYFWYVSEEKLEPRFGLRGVDPGDDRESPLDIARQAAALARDAAEAPDEEPVAAFLARRPAHRAIVRRVQGAAAHPYAEIQGNLIGAACRPIDLLRFKLAFLGASHFDPKSDRWTRISLARGAPTATDVAEGRGGDWSPIFGLDPGSAV